MSYTHINLYCDHTNYNKLIENTDDIYHDKKQYTCKYCGKLITILKETETDSDNSDDDIDTDEPDMPVRKL